MPRFPRLPEHGFLLGGLTLTRIIGWGSIFYAPSLLPGYVEPELGLTPATIFGGITILLLTAAAIAPVLGSRLDRRGTRLSMSAGAVVAAIGLALLSAAQGPASYLATWFVIGLGHSMMLGNVDTVTIVHLMGARSRRVIGLMMLATALSSGVFWPLAATLCAQFGWRTTWQIFAAMQLLIVLPIHLCIPVRRTAPPVAEAAADPAPSVEEVGRVQPDQRRVVFWLAALSFSASGMVSWGLPLHLISLLQNSGIGTATAVGIASLSAPATLLARLVDALAGERLPVERVALAGFAMGPLACLLLAVVPGSAAVAVVFVVMFSAAMGVISVARATLPLALFGRRGFARMMGRLAVPQNLSFAAAPLLLALIMERVGPFHALLICAAIQGAASLAMLALVRRINRP